MNPGQESVTPSPFIKPKQNVPWWQRTWLLAAGIVAIGSIFVNSEAGVPGLYIHKAPDSFEALVNRELALNKDKTFGYRNHFILLPSANTGTTGTWSLDSGIITLRENGATTDFMRLKRQADGEELVEQGGEGHIFKREQR